MSDSVYTKGKFLCVDSKTDKERCVLDSVYSYFTSENPHELNVTYLAPTGHESLLRVAFEDDDTLQEALTQLDNVMDERYKELEQKGDSDGGRF